VLSQEEVIANVTFEKANGSVRAIVEFPNLNGELRTRVSKAGIKNIGYNTWQVSTKVLESVLFENGIDFLTKNAIFLNDTPFEWYEFEDGDRVEKSFKLTKRFIEKWEEAKYPPLYRMVTNCGNPSNDYKPFIVSQLGFSYAIFSCKLIAPTFSDNNISSSLRQYEADALIRFLKSSQIVYELNKYKSACDTI